MTEKLIDDKINKLRSRIADDVVELMRLEQSLYSNHDTELKITIQFKNPDGTWSDFPC